MNNKVYIDDFENIPCYSQGFGAVGVLSYCAPRLGLHGYSSLKKLQTAIRRRLAKIDAEDQARREADGPPALDAAGLGDVAGADWWTGADDFCRGEN